MNDSRFQQRLNALAKANQKYKALLDECEQEYFDRFGFYPSDFDDDDWIDCFHVGTGERTVERVKEAAEDIQRRHELGKYSEAWQRVYDDEGDES